MQAKRDTECYMFHEGFSLKLSAILLSSEIV